MERAELGNIRKAEQIKLSFSRERQKLDWEGYASAHCGSDQYNETEDILLSYKNGKFFADGKEVSAAKFIEILGPGAEIAYRQRPDLKNIFESALLKEKGN